MSRVFVFLLTFSLLACSSKPSYEESDESSVSVKSVEYTETNESKGPLGTDKPIESSNDGSLQKPKLEENQVVMGTDTLTIIDEGKVYGVKVLNDSIYYYRNFISAKEETDIGNTFLKIRNNNGLLLSETMIEDEYVLDDGTSIIAINFKSNCIAHFSILSGTNNVMCLEVSLSDANDFIGYNRKLYIKLVNEYDYSYSNVMIIDSRDFSRVLIGFDYEGYLTLVNNQGSIELIDNDGNVVKVIN